MSNYLSQQNAFDTASDEAVLEASIKHPDLFALIVKRYEDAFIRKAKRILGDREEVRDIVQDVFVKIYLYGPRFKKQEGATFSSWGYRILVNTCFTFYQKDKKKRQYAIDLSDEDRDVLEEVVADKSVQDEFENKLDRDYLISLILKLPDTLRHIMERHIVEGKEQEDIAKEEKMTVGAVRARIHRARQALKELVTKDNNR